MAGGAVCTTQGVFIQFFGMATVLWTCAIAANLYATVCLKLGEYAEQYEKWYHIVVWSVSATLAIVVGAADQYGDAGLWCWVKGTDGGGAYRLGCFYSVLVLAWIFNCVIYVLRGYSATTWLWVIRMLGSHRI